MRIQEPQKAFRSLQRAYGAKEIDFVTKELVSQTLEKLQKDYRGSLKTKKGDVVVKEQPQEQPADTESNSTETPAEGQQ